MQDEIYWHQMQLNSMLTDTDTLLIVLEQDGTWLTQYLIDAECSLSGQFALSYADDAA